MPHLLTKQLLPTDLIPCRHIKTYSIYKLLCVLYVSISQRVSELKFLTSHKVLLPDEKIQKLWIFKSVSLLTVKSSLRELSVPHVWTRRDFQTIEHVSDHSQTPLKIRFHWTQRNIWLPTDECENIQLQE